VGRGSEVKVEEEQEDGRCVLCFSVFSKSREKYFTRKRERERERE